jgi:DNA-binding response OmpR family regulator
MVRRRWRGPTARAGCSVSFVLLADHDLERGDRAMAGLLDAGFEVRVLRGLAGLPRSAVESSVAIIHTDIAGVDRGGRELFERFMLALTHFRPELPLITVARSPDADLTRSMTRLDVEWHFTHEPKVGLLAAQVGRVLGEFSTTRHGTTVAAGELLLDYEAGVVQAAGVRVPLSPREFKLLSVLMQEPGRVYARDEIIRAMLPQVFVANERSVDVLISRLRKKLKAHLKGEGGSLLRTVTGVGYTIRPSAPVRTSVEG